MGEKTDRFAFRLPSDLASELREYASGHDESITAVVVSAVRGFLDGVRQDVGQDGFVSDDVSDTDGARDDALVTVLVEQLKSKDEQIASRDQQITALMTLMAMREAGQRKRLPWTKRVKAFFKGDVAS